MVRFIALVFTFFMLAAGVAGAKTLKLAVSERFWYPFSYVEKSQVKGMHVDIVKKALDSLGYKIEIKVLPSKRGLIYAKKGKVDGLISIAYGKDTSEYIDFPPDAAVVNESKWRIMQVDHIVVNHKETVYEFEGNIKSLPGPIRIPFGESFTNSLKKKGHVVYETKSDIQNFKMLMRDRKGSVITTSVIAERMFILPDFNGELVIQAVPLVSQSYYLAFSEKADISKEEKQKIWDAISGLRDDYVYMLQLFAQY